MFWTINNNIWWINSSFPMKKSRGRFETKKHTISKISTEDWNSTHLTNWNKLFTLNDNNSNGNILVKTRITFNAL